MKEYVYRKHLREPIKFLLVIMVLLISMILEIGIISGLRADAGERGIISAIFSVVAVVLFIILGLEFLFLYHIMFKKFKNIKVLLNDEGITYHNIKGTQFIDYKSIQAIQFPSIKYFGGWVKIKSSGQTIRLTVVLENIGEFVKELKEKLDERGLSNLYSDKKVYDFCKTGIYSDHSWGRLYEKMKISSILYFIGMILAIVYSGFINTYGFLLLYTLVIMLYPFIAYIVAEIILGKKFSNKIKQEGHLIYERDKTQENIIYRNSYIALGILIVIFLIVSAI
jgi:hypothetical protein